MLRVSREEPVLNTGDSLDVVTRASRGRLSSWHVGVARAAVLLSQVCGAPVSTGWPAGLAMEQGRVLLTSHATWRCAQDLASLRDWVGEIAGLLVEVVTRRHVGLGRSSR